MGRSMIMKHPPPHFKRTPPFNSVSLRTQTDRQLRRQNFPRKHHAFLRVAKMSFPFMGLHFCRDAAWLRP